MNPSRLLDPVAAALLITLTLGWPAGAYAYRTAKDSPEVSQLVGDARVAWGSAIELHISTEGLGASTAERVRDEVADALATWSGPSCARLPRTRLEISSGSARDGDEASTIQLIADGWTEKGFDKTSPGSTVVEYAIDRSASEPQAAIVEADLYLNAEHFSLGGTSPEDPSMAAVITHELGHVLGLLHPCGTEATPEVGAPACSSDLHFAEATMHPEYDPGQVSLGQDDIDGICYLYPTESAGTGDGASVLEAEDACEGEPIECDAANVLDGGVSDAGVQADAEVLPQWFGLPCDAGAQCESRVCLKGDPEPSVCTRRCDGDGGSAMCPSGWKCAPVDDTRACVPRDSGCAVIGVGPRRRWAWAPWAVLGVVVLVRSRRRGGAAR